MKLLALVLVVCAVVLSGCGSFSLSELTNVNTDTASEIAKLAGSYEGKYACAQGVTGLSLTISAHSSPDNKNIAAVFAFSALPENPDVATGSFKMLGTYDAVEDSFSLTSTEWIERPDGYEMVSLEGSVGDTTFSTLQGDVTSAGCSAFALARTM